MPRVRRRGWILAGVAALVLAGAAVVWSAYRADMAAAHARLAGRSTVLDSPFGPIEVATLGEGPPVVVLHGSGGGFDQGLAAMAGLAERGFRLIAPSRFGYLRSARPEGASPAMQADAVAWLMDALEIEEAAVAGLSAGALPALQTAIRHPQRVRAVVLLVPASYAPGRAAGENAMGGPLGEAIALGVLRSDVLFWAGIRLAPDFLTRALLATEPAVVAAAPPAERARVRGVLERILPVSDRAQGLIDDTRWAAAPPRYALEDIAAPLLAVGPRDDLFGTHAAASYTAAEVPDGRLVSYPSGGHVLVGREEQAMDAIAAFLNAIAQQ